MSVPHLEFGKIMPSIRQFEALRALASHRHFGRAAQALGVTQPALTRSLQKLEHGLGAPLFDRQGMAPTAFGEAALRFADPAAGGKKQPTNSYRYKSPDFTWQNQKSMIWCSS